MKLLLVIIIFLLVGCNTNPVPVTPPEFPPISDSMRKGCPELAQASNSELLSELLKTVVINYGEYHKCRALVETWQKWYDEQKQNNEKLRNEKHGK